MKSFLLSLVLLFLGSVALADPPKHQPKHQLPQTWHQRHYPQIIVPRTIIVDPNYYYYYPYPYSYPYYPYYGNGVIIGGTNFGIRIGW